MANHVVLARRWARSLAFAVPAFLARQLNWQPGQMLFVNVEDGALVIREFDPRKAIIRNGTGQADTARPG